MSRTPCMRHGTRCSTPTASAHGWPSSTPISPRAVLSLMSDSSRTATISVACGCIKPGCKAATLPATLTAIPAERPPAGVDPQHFWGGCLMCRHGCAVDDSCIENFDTARESRSRESAAPRERGWEAVMFTLEELATIPLFSTLGDKELEYLAGAVEDIHLIPG